MAFTKKAQLTVAASKRTKLDLPQTHVTTSDFMDFSIAKAIEVVPTAKYNIKHELFSRLEPMPVPTFGRAVIRSRAYFVPFRTVFPAWDDFIEDVPHIYNNGTKSLIPSVPTTSMQILRSAFVLNNELTEITDASAYDIEYVKSASVTEYRNFTPAGRKAYKLLRTLGYQICFDYQYDDTVSLLPLFCAGRVYCDWFYPSQYANDADSSWMLSLFQYNDSWAGGLLLTDQTMLRLLKIIGTIVYDPDYFTSAWDNPVSPNEDLHSNFDIPDITSNGGSRVRVYSTPGQESPIIRSDSSTSQGGSANAVNLSQYTLDALKDMTDYMRRHQIAGSRVMDRHLARWGVSLKSDQMRRSVYLGDFEQNIQFGDVTSTADTDGASLGSYAGKGISYGTGNFELSTDEHGMLIIVTTIMPYVGYYQGINRHIKHLSKLDFFTPEFDNLGTQAIAKQELYLPISALPTDTGATYNEAVFGFTPRYAEYKKGDDQLTGDFILGSRNVGKDSWTLFRDVTHFVNSSESADENLNDMEHSYDFVKGFDKSQYNRIFYNTNDNADHFNIIHLFDIKCSFPGSSLFDSYEFDNEDEAKKITMEVGGTTHN